MTTGVLLMAYGSPGSTTEIADYLSDVRGGRPFSDELLADLTARYERIGGTSPLLQITQAQADGLQRVLGDGYRTFIGMKHWRPSIADAVQAISEARIDHVIGVALAPHYSKMSIGGYEQRTRAANGAFELHMVPSWYDEPSFVTAASDALRATIGDDDDARVFFTAHSLPARIIDERDPYLDQLHASAKLVADAAGARSYEFAFQSASHTGEPWLGPDVLERVAAFAADGGTTAIVHPIGFVADHLEVLYDVDVECAAAADAAGLRFRRVPSPNDHPAFIDALADVVHRAEDAA
jgi:protoporphyrin/coproporphyrin ferrochelatase